MRKFFVVLVLFLAVAFVILSFSQLESVLRTLQQGNLWFLALAILCETGWFVIVGLTFKSIYNLLGLGESRRRLTLVAAAANLVNVIAPAAGVGGIALFVDDGRRRGLSVAKVMVSGALFVLADYAAFLCVLTLGLIVLFRRNNLQAGEITATLVLLTIACILAFLVYLGYRSAEALGSFLARMVRLVNRLAQPVLHRPYLSETRALAFAAEVGEGLSSVPEKPRSLLPPVLLALLNKATLMGVLVCAFLAFGVPFSGGTIIGGFAIAYLFLIVSPTPSGIGVVEGVMALALSSLKVPWSQAVVVTLAYRGITFWLPLAVGAWALRNLHLPAEVE